MAKQSDMWTMINRELSRLDTAKGGASDTPYVDIIRDTMSLSKENKAWKERQNLQMQKMMDLQIEGYQSNFGEADIQKKQDRLQQYISRNQGSMNDMTLEYADLLKENIKDHGAKVGKFKGDVELLEVNRDQWLQKADDYFNREDALNEQDYSNIEDSIDDYVRMKNEMLENNADFLQLPAYKHVLTNMVGQEAVINDLLKEAKDQGVFTKYEHGYLTQALKTGDYSIIEEERAKKKVLTSEYMKSLVAGPEGIEAAYNRDAMLNQLLDGKSIISDGVALAELGFVSAGQSITLKDVTDMDGGKLALAQIKKDSKANVDRLNNIYREKTGDDYIVARGGVSEHTSEGWSPSPSQIKILKDHYGKTDDEIKLLGLDEATELIDKYDKEIGGDGKEDKDSVWPNIATGIVLAGGIGQVTGMNQKLLEGSKQVLKATKEGMKYVHHVAKNVPLEDISSFLDDKVVAEAVEDLNMLREEMDVAKESGEYSKAYKDAVKKYNKKVTQHANALKTGGRVSLEGVRGSGKKVTKAIKSFPVKELERLLKNPHKWSTLKIKRNALKIMPGLAKGWRTVTPGGGFASFELGRRATREVAESNMGEGLGAEITGIAGGYGMQKAAFSKVSKKIASKVGTAAGRNWLVKKMAKKMAAKVAVSTMTGLMAGGGTPASIATGTIGLLAGIGMVGWDIYDLFIKDDEGEE